MKYWLYFFIITSITALVALAGIIFVTLEYKQAQDELFIQGTAYKAFLFEQRKDQDSEISRLHEEFDTLQERLHDEEDKYDDLYDEVKDSLRTVELLKRYSQTDKELLQKYSQVYFLNEHYDPKKLKDIDEKYLITSKQLQTKSEIAPFLEELLEAADEDDIDLRVLSAYRSFNTQSDLKQRYVVTYGATQANTFSADQGYSEHQLGTTIDFTTPKLGSDLSGFKNSEAYQWLEKRAYKYGFVISYPEDNAYYQFEPWHWRFVGKELAKELHREKQNFYDMSQRDINGYLIDIFED